jgi:hypothetical protein
MTTEARALPPGQQRYVKVNGSWPTTLPPMTGQEAKSAAKRLYRLAMGRPFKGPIRVASGNRHTWLRYGEMIVNPDQGWDRFVHDLSHYFFRRLHPALRPHDWRHAHLERQLIETVVSKGWLKGKLRREPKPKPDIRLVRHQRVLVRIKAWERKLKRAQTALRKLQKTKAYYEKQGGP